MILNELLEKLAQEKAAITRRAFTIIIDIPPESISRRLLSLLQELLNNYGQAYHITFQGLPPCLMPGARHQILTGPEKHLTYRRIPACQNCSLKDRCPGWCCNITLSSQNIEPIADMPSEIVIEITGRCNLNCNHCTSETKNAQHASFKTAKKIIDDAKTCHIPAIRFTGGEPLLNPALPEMLRYAKSQGLYVLLNTNATLVNPAFARILSSSVDNVLVSLQGFNSSSDRTLTHSSFPFLTKIKNIFLLRSYVPIVRLGTVITPTLIAHWPQYAALINNIQPAAWELFRPMNFRMKNQSRLTVNDYRKLALKVLKLKKEGINVKLANALPFCIFPSKLTDGAILLGALSDDGNSRLVWDVQGYFKPSYFIDKKLGRDINTAWNHSFLKKLKMATHLPTRCRQCAHLPWCRGGSRAMARKTYHTYSAPDPLFVSA